VNGDVEPPAEPAALLAGADPDDRPVEPRRPRLAFLTSDFANKVAQTFVTEALLGVVGLATGIATARWLGPAGKGEFALVTTVVVLIFAFTNFGISQSIVYFSSRLPAAELTASGLSLAASMGALSLVVGAGLTFLGAFSLLELDEPALALGLLALPLLHLDASARALMQGAYRLAGFNLLRLVQPLAFLPLLACGLLLADPVTGTVAAWIGAQGLSAAASVTAVIRGRSLGLRSFVPDLARWRGLLGFGARTHLGSVLKFFQYRFDVLVVGALLDKRRVGLYVVALSLSELPWRIPDAVGVVLFPRIARSSEKSDRQDLTPLICRHTFLLTLICSTALFVTAPWIIRLLFGARFEEAYLPARLLLPGGLALCLWKVLAQHLIASGRPNAYSLSAFCSLVTMLAGCALLIPPFGLAGAALASSTAYLVATASLFTVYRRSTGNSLGSCLVMRRADFALYRDLVGRRRKG